MKKLPPLEKVCEAYSVRADEALAALADASIMWAACPSLCGNWGREGRGRSPCYTGRRLHRGRIRLNSEEFHDHHRQARARSLRTVSHR